MSEIGLQKWSWQFARAILCEKKKEKRQMIKFVDKLIKEVTLNNIEKLIKNDCPIDIIQKSFENVSEEEIMKIIEGIKTE